MEDPIRMPGSFQSAYNFENTRSARIPPFQIPSETLLTPTQLSPSACSLFLSASDSKTSSRKRARLSKREDEYTSSISELHNGCYASRESTFSFEAPSPAPLVNTDYILAGGLDTSASTDLLQEQEQDNLECEQDYRPNRYIRASLQRSMDNKRTPHTPSFDRDDDLRKRRLSQSIDTDQWSKTIWALTGGLAGKVLSFCWSNTFRGFHAGGGHGYTIDNGTPSITLSESWTDVKETEDVFHAHYRKRNSILFTPIPGGFPKETDSNTSTSSRVFQASTRLEDSNETPTQNQTYCDTSRDRSSLRNSWVIVDTPEDMSPARKKSRPSMASLHAHPYHQSSTTPPQRHRPRLVRSGSSRSSMTGAGASYASPRGTRVSTGAEDLSHSYTKIKSPSHHRSRSVDIQAVHHPRKHTRNLSTVSSITPHCPSDKNTISNQVQIHDSNSKAYPSPEILKFEKKIRRTNQKQEDSMRRMNEQMQSLMREAQNALITKVEVLDSDVDVQMESDTGYK